MGNAWFVDKIYIADGPRQESDALNSIDLSHEAVVDKSFAPLLMTDSPSKPEDAVISLAGFTPKSLDYEYSSSTSGTVVFSEIYYPYGWKASIDGEPVEHFRANYTLRALNVPAGHHNINFTFDPESVRKGDTLASICVILMYLLAIAAAAFGIVKLIRRKNAGQ